jgi:phospholipase/lecithinase/hemolysin
MDGREGPRPARLVLQRPWRAILSALLIFAGGGQVADAQDGGTGPDQLFVLGDSLSDVGNAASLSDYLLEEPFHPEHTIGFCNPGEVFLLALDCTEIFFRRSRVSDGPVAVEYLAAALGLPELTPSFHILPERPVVGTNYAVAGATARGEGLDDLSAQLDALQQDHGPQLSATALYVVIVGGNDAVDALKAGALPGLIGVEEALPGTDAADGDAVAGQTGQIVAAAVDAIGRNVVRLIAAGARHVVVANVPELGALPAVRDTASRRGIAEEAAVTAAQAVTAAFNDRLEAQLSAIERAHPGTRLEPFDFEASLEAELAAAGDAGLNTRDACFDSTAYRSLLPERVFHDGCAPEADGAPRFERFLFWDGLHPSGILHAALGGALSEDVADAAPARLTQTSERR